MEVRLTPEQEAQLHQLAATRGRGPDQLAQEVLSNYLEQQARFGAAVQLGKEQIALGEGIPHQEIVARYEKRYGG